MSEEFENSDGYQATPEQPAGSPESNQNSVVDEEVDEEEHTEGIAHSILDEFSAEGNILRLTKLTKLPKHTVTYIMAAICFIIGVLCVAITSQITEVLPYLVGGIMVLIGATRFIIALVTHEYRHLRTNRTAMSLIVTALGIMIIVQHVLPDNNSAITFISIVWGILGLLEGAHALNHAFKRIANSERCVYFLIRGIVELVVAFMLLYDPGNHATHHFHIIVFGINLIMDSVTMIPQVKAFLATK